MSTKDDVLAAVKHGEDQYKRGLRAALEAVMREISQGKGNAVRAIERLLEEAEKGRGGNG